MEQKSVCTICRFCGKQCHLLADLDQEGKVYQIRPDSEYHTIWCATGRNGWNLLNSPQRIQKPLRRTGKKGENQWKEISWEEAFDEIGRKFRDTVDTYGPNSFLGIRGFNKPYFNLIYERLINTIGTVNSMGAANMCHAASMNGARETFGFMPNPRITEYTRFVVLWGSNPHNTEKELAVSLQNACKSGAKLIVIDPCKTRHTQNADIWLPIRPGTDMALTLGMVHLVIEQGWYDKVLMEKSACGFEELKESTKEYTLEKTARMTGLSERVIYDTARLIALEGPGIIHIGNAMDHNADSFQKCRIINILIALTGNVDRNGALTARGPMSSKFMQQRKQISRAEVCPFNDPQKRRQMIGYQESYLDNFNESSGKALADAINTQKPYPIKAVYVQGGNPAMIWENREELVKTFCKIDFLVVSDFFLTPTAMLADIFLPAAVYLEYESVMIDAGENIYYAPKLVQDETAKSDLEIMNEMGKAMGYGEYFWETMEDYWDEFLEPFGVTLEQVRKEKVILAGTKPKDVSYGKFREQGFPTKTGKINLYSEAMAEKGNDPVPIYREYAKPTKQYPYLSTNYKSEHFYHTAGRQIETQRNREPEAIALVSRDIAQERAIQEGDYILVYTAAGSVCQKAHIEDKMAKQTVALAHGWWYPEKENSPFALEACSNNIVFDDRLIGRELPSFTTRGVPCNVTKVLQYEEIYPANAPYEVHIAIPADRRSAKYERVSEQDKTAGILQVYMQTVDALAEKGFLEGLPEFVLTITNRHEEALIPILKERGFCVNVYVEEDEIPEACCLGADKVIFRLFGRPHTGMESYIRNIKKENPSALYEIEYVMEQRNIDQKHIVKNLAEELQIPMHVKYACFTARQQYAYLAGEMSTHDIIAESKRYFFHYVDELDERKEFYYQKHRGREPVIVNADGKLESEWDLSGDILSALDEVTDYHAWRETNKKTFWRTVRKPQAGLWWIWKREGRKR